MRNGKKRLLRAVLCPMLAVMLCIFLPALSVFAETTRIDGLEVSIEVDQDAYESTETITFTVTVTNVTENDITVAKLEQLIPENYSITDDTVASMENFVLSPGASVRFVAVAEPDADDTQEETTTILTWLLEEKTANVPNYLLLLAAIAILVIFFKLT